MKIYNIILSDIIHEGWLETLAEAHKYDRHQRQVTELYCNSHEELTIEDGLVYKGHCLGSITSRCSGKEPALLPELTAGLMD